MNHSAVQVLGHDIWLCDAPEGADSMLAGRYRFLDELWLPCPLSELSEPQILVINRYRERVILQGQQYASAVRARNALAAVASAISARSVLEIGCGKFPVEVGAQYLGIDIDAEALNSLASRGISACHPDSIDTTLISAVDLVVSSYAMHFPISDDIIANITKFTTSDAIFCFNMIVDNPASPLELMARLSLDWPFCSVVKTPEMARREFFFVMARECGWSNVAFASSAVRQAL